MLSRKFDTDPAQAIQDLVTYATAESCTLEYKSQLFDLKNQEQRSKVLSSVIAMANTDGGDIVFGIEEINEVASAVVGVQSKDVEPFRETLMHLLRDAVEPSISEVTDRTVFVEGARSAYVLRLKPSSAGPHREKHTRRFHLRTARGKAEMGINDIRTAVLRQEVVLDAFDRFRKERLSSLTDFSFYGVFPYVVLHGVPLYALSRHSRRLVDYAALNPFQMANTDPVDLDAYNRYGFTRATLRNQQCGACGFSVLNDGSYEGFQGGVANPWPMPNVKNPGFLLVHSSIVQLIKSGWAHCNRIHETAGFYPALFGISLWVPEPTYLAGSSRPISHNPAQYKAPIESLEVRVDQPPATPIALGGELKAALLPLYNAFGLSESRLPLEDEAWT